MSVAVYVSEGMFLVRDLTGLGADSKCYTAVTAVRQAAQQWGTAIDEMARLRV